jgi:hypothetical protein
MSEFFISYEGGDQFWAKWVARELGAAGHTAVEYDWSRLSGTDVYSWLKQRPDGPPLCLVSEEYLKAPFSTIEQHAKIFRAATERPGVIAFAIVKPVRLPNLSENVPACELFGVGEDEARQRFRSFFADWMAQRKGMQGEAIAGSTPAIAELSLPAEKPPEGPPQKQRHPRIFISYRRDDSAGHAGRLHDRLVGEFGRDLLFMDIDAIPLGENFVTVLREKVAACDVLLAVIGRNWLDSRDRNGSRRLVDENDFLRVEIATALQRNIPVIPVLLDGATLPEAGQLPADLAELSLRQALGIRNDAFHSDVDRLIRDLKVKLR